MSSSSSLPDFRDPNSSYLGGACDFEALPSFSVLKPSSIILSHKEKAACDKATD